MVTPSTTARSVCNCCTHSSGLTVFAVSACMRSCTLDTGSLVTKVVASLLTSAVPKIIPPKVRSFSGSCYSPAGAAYPARLLHATPRRAKLHGSSVTCAPNALPLLTSSFTTGWLSSIQKRISVVPESIVDWIRIVPDLRSRVCLKWPPSRTGGWSSRTRTRSSFSNSWPELHASLFDR